MNSDFKVLFVCNAIVRAIAFICTTIAAIEFNKWGILFFYLVPMFMGIDYKTSKKRREE